MQHIDEIFYKPDPSATGVKGLVFVGNDIVVYRRDTNTNVAPLKIDLLGGGIEEGETPFQAFRREVKEECNLTIHEDDIAYVRRYPTSHTDVNGKAVHLAEYFPVARLGREHEQQVRLGDEGTDCRLISLDTYLKLTDAIPAFQERAAEYIRFVSERI